MYVDTREKGKLIEHLQKTIPVEKMTMDAGDYLIPKDDKFILIERSSFSDFAGKIMSGRLWYQIGKCKEVTDDIYFIVENPYRLRYLSKGTKSALWSAIASISRQVNVLVTMNQYDTFLILKHLYNKYNTNRKVSQGEVRVKPKKMSAKKQAKFALMGLNGIGEQKADLLLAENTLSTLAKMKVKDLTGMVESKLAKRIHAVFRA